jgi:CheY-like chemotaxis protein
VVIIKSSGEFHSIGGDVDVVSLRKGLVDYYAREKLNTKEDLLGLFRNNVWYFYSLRIFQQLNFKEKEHIMHDLINFLSAISIQEENRDIEYNFSSILEFFGIKNGINPEYLDSYEIKNTICKMEKIGRNSEIVFDAWEKTVIKVSNLEIQRILLNLLKNADEAHKQQGVFGKIRLSLRCKIQDGKSYVVLSVSDQGGGVCEEQITKIFQRGFSSKNSSGLGLVIVKNLLEKVGGFCQCNSKLNHGTEFDLFFPAVEMPKKLRIIVLENEQIIAKDLVRKLKILNKNYEISVFHSLESAKRCGEGFDLVFFDEKLPKGSGKTIIPFVRRNNPEIKIVRFSAMQNNHLGYCLQKPVKLSRLASLLTELFITEIMLHNSAWQTKT